MHRMIILLNLFVFLFISECNAKSNAWQLKKDHNGIKVYVRAHEESSFDEFKAITTIQECSLNDALELILDVNNYEAWFPDCVNPKVLEQIDKYHDIHYIETVSPWPVQNRCGVYEQTTTISNNDTKAEIVFLAQNDYPIEVTDMVRINEASGKWTLEEKNNALTITYQFKGNPGGKIPAWLANSFVVKHPYKTLENFKMLLEE
jgi:hypothetical protein